MRGDQGSHVGSSAAFHRDEHESGNGKRRHGIGLNRKPGRFEPFAPSLETCEGKAVRANLPRDPRTGEQHHLFSAERKETADETADASRACNDDPAAHRATVRQPQAVDKAGAWPERRRRDPELASLADQQHGGAMALAVGHLHLPPA